MTEQASSPRKQLVAALVKISGQADIIAALELADPTEFDAEFWRVQCFTAQHRFYSLCRHLLGLTLAKEVDECSDSECLALKDQAESLFNGGMRYLQVRQWFLTQGRLQHALDYAVRHEAERLQRLALGVLVILEPKGAKWLGLASDGVTPILVNTPQEGIQLPVRSITSLDKTRLAEIAKDFGYIKDRFNAKEVKVLPVDRKPPQ